MSDSTLPQLKAEEVQKKHRQQFLVQILLPVMVGIILTIYLGVLAAGGGGDGPAVWANIATILLTGVVSGTALVMLVVVAASGYGVSWLIHKTPTAGKDVDHFLADLSQKISDYTDRISKPVIETKSIWAGLTRIFHFNKKR